MSTIFIFILFAYFMEFLRKDKGESTMNCLNIVICIVGLFVAAAIKFENPMPVFIFCRSLWILLYPSMKRV